MEFSLAALGAWQAAQPPAADARLRLESTAEPGWKLVVGLAQTAVEPRHFERVECFRGHQDWLVAFKNELHWHGRCGPGNLDELLSTFLDFAQGREQAPVLVAPLGPDLLSRVDELGIDPDFAGLYGPERLRWALESLHAAQRRGPVLSAAAWVEKTLEDHWGRPQAILQRPLPFAEAAARAAAPPAGTCWARERATGLLFAVLDADDLRVQLAGGVAVPSHLWAGWEWLVEPPEGFDQPQQTPSEDPRRVALGRMKAWVAAFHRNRAEVVAKLDSLGLSADEWEAYKAESG